MNQKLEDSFELALGVTPEEREKSDDLNVGYDAEEETWELIVKYSGDIERLRSNTIRIETLYGGYAIVRLLERELESFSNQPEVEYIEQPKRLYFEVYEGRYASCIPQVQRPPDSLSGEGTIVAAVDSGVDYTHPDFCNEDGTTRILKLWDQGVPDGVYDSARINEALAAKTPEERYRIVPSMDTGGHGTAVLGIAAGNGRASRGENKAVATRSNLIVVKMGTSGVRDFPRTTELLRGVDFCVRQAIEYKMPLALNLSFGNSYGSHDGTSLVETYLDNISQAGKTTIIVATGNEGGKRRHTSGQVNADNGNLIEMAIGEGERNLSLQIWKNYVDEYEIRLIAPSGNSVVISETPGNIYKSRLDNTVLMWIFGTPTPYSSRQEIYLEMIPDGNRKDIQSGIWKIVLAPKKIVSGEFEMWLPAGGAIGEETGFLVSVPETTLTIPSTAARVISVGAYNARTESVATFSGWGPLANNMQKPDLVAPGVDILAPSVGGYYSIFSGTSMAAPFVTGSVSLLNEWGIVRGNDPYLYGEKAKAYLVKGARQLPGFRDWPNAQAGWGALCLADSIPR